MFCKCPRGSLGDSWSRLQQPIHLRGRKMARNHYYYSLWTPIFRRFDSPNGVAERHRISTTVTYWEWNGPQSCTRIFDYYFFLGGEPLHLWWTGLHRRHGSWAVRACTATLTLCSQGSTWNYLLWWSGSCEGRGNWVYLSSIQRKKNPWPHVGLWPIHLKLLGLEWFMVFKVSFMVSIQLKIGYYGMHGIWGLLCWKNERCILCDDFLSPPG